MLCNRLGSLEEACAVYPGVDLNPQKYIRLMLQKSILEKQKKVMNPKCYKYWLYTVASSSLFWPQKPTFKAFGC